MDYISPAGIEVKVGQTWQEVDPRHERIVSVIDLGEIDATVYTKSKGIYSAKRERVPAVRLQCGNRRTWAKLSRFTGKRGGYRLLTT